jgi:hypothetical protein
VERRRRALPQQLVPRAQGAQVVARVGQVGGMPVLHSPIEEPAPPFRPSLDQRQIVRREGDDRQPTEQLVGIAHGLVVDARRPASVRNCHVDVAHPAGQLESPGDRGLLASEAHQLREPLRA